MSFFRGASIVGFARKVPTEGFAVMYAAMVSMSPCTDSNAFWSEHASTSAEAYPDAMAEAWFSCEKGWTGGGKGLLETDGRRRKKRACAGGGRTR